MKVDIYWNIHKKIFSVKDRETGKVIAHVGWAWLDDVKYVVQPAGRERVLKEKRENVHAFVRGFHNWDCLPPQDDDSFITKEITYNPYKHKTFVSSDSKEIAQDSEYCYLYIKDGKPAIEGWYERR
jgi:hypothetical protein